MLGSAYFIGWTTFAIAIPRLADIYGRKKIYSTAMLVQAPVICTMIFSQSIMLTTAMLFMMGVCAAGRASVGFLYIMEMVPNHAKSFVASMVGMLDCMTMIYATIYFMFISHDSVYWEYFAVFQNIATILLVLMYVPESPKWLFEKGRFKEARETLMYLAKRNGVDE